MSDPNANRIGGARGPDGRTLTDVYNMLGSVNDNLTLLRGLVSTTNDNLVDIKNEISGLENQNYSAVLTRIADTLRQEGELPEDTSIFRLLASMDVNIGRSADCCEENSGGTGGGNGGGGQKDEPTDLCIEEAAGARNSGWIWPGDAVISDTTYRVFVPMFASLPTGPAEIITGQGSLNSAGFQLSGAGRFDLIIQWDFTDDAEKPEYFTFGSALFGSGLFENAWYGETEPTAGNMTRGCYSTTIDGCAFGSNDVEQYYIAFAFPDSLTAVSSVNVWAQQVALSCDS
jgi:hypothetical protein